MEMRVTSPSDQKRTAVTLPVPAWHSPSGFRAPAPDTARYQERQHGYRRQQRAVSGDVPAAIVTF